MYGLSLTTVIDQSESEKRLSCGEILYIGDCAVRFLSVLKYGYSLYLLQKPSTLFLSVAGCPYKSCAENVFYTQMILGSLSTRTEDDDGNGSETIQLIAEDKRST